MVEFAKVAAVVTGATKGIGRAISEALVSKEGRVVVSIRTAADVEVMAHELSEQGPGEAHGFACDVRHPERCEELIRVAVDRFGGLDILVNNAGLGRFSPIQEMDPADWDLQIRTNLDGVFHCSRLQCLT